MPLPILQVHHDPTPQDLVRLFHRTQLHWVRHVGEETQLDAGVAFTNPQLPGLADANLVMDAALPPGASPAAAVAEVNEHFRQTGAACRQWFFNPAAPASQVEPLVRHLIATGWRAHPYDILHLAGRPAERAGESPALTIIPARASFRHARELAEVAAGGSPDAQQAEADMLHLDDPHWDASVALRDGTAVARAGVLAVGDMGRIEQVFVSPSHRRQGIGRTMMGRVLDVCARSLFKHVMVCVAPQDRPAVGLCAPFGFRRIGQIVAYREAAAS